MLSMQRWLDLRRTQRLHQRRLSAGWNMRHAYADPSADGCADGCADGWTDCCADSYAYGWANCAADGCTY